MKWWAISAWRLRAGVVFALSIQQSRAQPFCSNAALHASAPSKLEIGVGETDLGWETPVNKEVSHVQEVHRSSFRGRAPSLPGSRQETKGIVAEGASGANLVEG